MEEWMNNNAYVNPLEKENAELRAQLARCVSAISNNELFDEDYRNEFVGSLPATANHDAEILRCAEDEFSDHNAELLINPWAEMCKCPVCDAVRAREEATK